MTTTMACSFHKVFRFSLALLNNAGEEKSIGLLAAQWEGPHLVFTRGMQREPVRPGLASELQNTDEIRVQLWTAEGEVARTWRVTYEKIRDRGFLWMNATVDGVAQEAVCLVNAELREVRA